MIISGLNLRLAILATLILMLIAPSVEAARSSGRLAGITIGGRSESSGMVAGLTGSFFAEQRLTTSLIAFAVFDYHRINHQQLIWEGGGKVSFSGIGTNLGFKLCIPGRRSPVSLSPGVAIGFLALPEVMFGPGQFGTVRFSLELGFLPRQGAGLLFELSSLNTISGGEWGGGDDAKPLISFRAGIIWRVK